MCTEKYVRIVEEMLARGEKITLQEVRRVAGRGSYATISDAVKLVLNQGLIPTEVSGPVPETLIDETKRLWQEACRLASSAVASERLALHSARVSSQESQRELTALADSLALQVDELTAQLESMQADKVTAEKRAQEADAGLKATRQLLKDIGIKPAKMGVEKGQTMDEA
ncbi:hypothetical protein TPL01_12370 [Sulfuriferula plumbiphila]|uniref:KfrA N-terminal DNA-binding domain-containing protein n=1 Tax=Sulfuriferula plumbiphila TaxID=171865 RepID=A0A512L6J9_9PROT|nr:DNA-binding protein [Sulfuriferula plumbiphila]BBP04826.1 hypothetical protein SFPGR_22480 [Sulfuriferula plumbiphila]GEP30099.1 hypothetical protein TPL01_12370 [Sulfuriferula plumbiphila]